MLVQDTTTASWFTVESDSGGGSAVVTQPSIDTRSSSATVLPTLVTPLTADNFTVWRPGVLHVSQTGGISVNGQVFIQMANVTSPSGAGGQSNLYGGITCQHCIFSTYVSTGTQLEGNKPGVVGGTGNGKPSFLNCVLLAGIDALDPFIYGGSVWGPMVLRPNAVQCVYGGGMYINGSIAPISFSGGGKHQMGDMGFFCTPATALNLLGAGNGRQGNGEITTGTDACPGSTAAVWGTTNWPIKSGGIHMLKVGAVAELKITGLITLCGLNTGATYTPSTGVFTAQTAITIGSNAGLTASTNIDAAISGGATGVIAPGNFAGFIKEV